MIYLTSFAEENLLCDQQMKTGLPQFLLVILLALFSSPQSVFAIRFIIDREECFAHDVKYERDTVHVSFVVIKVEGAWHYSQEGVDLVVSYLFLFPFSLVGFATSCCLIAWLDLLILLPCSFNC